MDMRHRKFYRKKEKRSVAGLVMETIDLFRGYEIGTPQYDAKVALNSKVAQELMMATDKSKIVGSTNGGTFTVKVHKKTPYMTVNKSTKETTVAQKGKLEIIFKIKGDASSRRNKSYLKLNYYFITPVRSKKSTKR